MNLALIEFCSHHKTNVMHTELLKTIHIQLHFIMLYKEQRNTRIIRYISHFDLYFTFCDFYLFLCMHHFAKMQQCSLILLKGIFIEVHIPEFPVTMYILHIKVMYNLRELLDKMQWLNNNKIGGKFSFVLFYF